MARFRRGARKAPRHTGQDFGRGYQYRAPEPYYKRLGPWTGVAGAISNSTAPADTVDIPEDRLMRTGLGIIEPGAGVFGALKVTAADTLSNQGALGAFNVVVAGTAYHLFFFADTDASDVICVTRNGTTHTSALVAATPTKRISCVVWGSLVYFTGAGLSGIYTYDPAAGTFSAVISGSPAAAEFLFVLGNNMVALVGPSTWTAYWAVDSDPTDWTGEGSGSNPIDPTKGAIHGHGEYLEGQIIIGTHGAVFMRPTGTLPAFSFEQLPQIRGSGALYAQSSCPLGFVYAGADNLIHAFDGRDQVIPIPSKFDASVRTSIYYSGDMGLLLISMTAGTTEHLWINNSGEVVGRDTSLPSAYDFVADGYSSVGGLIFYEGLGDDNSQYTTYDIGTLAENRTFVIQTGYVDLGGIVQIDKVMTLWNGTPASGNFNITTELDGQLDQILITTPEVDDQRVIACRTMVARKVAFQLTITNASRVKGLVGIEIHGYRVNDSSYLPRE